MFIYKELYFCVLLKSILNWTHRMYIIFMPFVIHPECVSRPTWSYDLFPTMHSIVVSLFSPSLPYLSLFISVSLCLLPLFRFHSHVWHSALICEQISSTPQPKKSLLPSIFHQPTLPICQLPALSYIHFCSWWEDLLLSILNQPTAELTHSPNSAL